jgi:hypothetical protein
MKEMEFSELRPEDRRDPDLGVGDLPQEEIGDAALPARPDQEIRIGEAGGVEVARNGLFVHRPRVRDPVRQDALHGIDDLGPAAIVQGHAEAHFPIAARDLLHPVELAAGSGRQTLLAAEDGQTEVVLDEDLVLFPEELDHQAEQGRNFALGPLPVLGGERVQRQDLHAGPGGRLYDLPDGLDARPVALDPGQIPGFRPAAVAVHDDGHVPGNPGEVDLAGQALFLASRSEKSL